MATTEDQETVYGAAVIVLKELIQILGWSQSSRARGHMLHYHFNFVLLQFSRIYRDTEDRLITQLRKGSSVTQGKVISLDDRTDLRMMREGGQFHF